jgi:hypothetical protein
LADEEQRHHDQSCAGAPEYSPADKEEDRGVDSRELPGMIKHPLDMTA